MPTRKISDEQEKPCSHHDHNPPSHMVFEPGLYEHECPACHKKVTFRVQSLYMYDNTPRCACHGDGSHPPGVGSVINVDGWPTIVNAKQTIRAK